jgi:hypothetical protein
MNIARRSITPATFRATSQRWRPSSVTQLLAYKADLGLPEWVHEKITAAAIPLVAVHALRHLYTDAAARWRAG